jgi:hypothetical protein
VRISHQINIISLTGDFQDETLTEEISQLLEQMKQNTTKENIKGEYKDVKHTWTM